jgi:hypothetical protein
MHNKAPLALSILIMIAAGYAVIGAWSWPWKAALFPLAIGIPVFCFATLEVALGFLGKTAEHGDDVKDFQLSSHLPEKETLRRTAIGFGWILGFFAVVALIGFEFAVPLFVFLYMKVQGDEGWVFSLVFAAIVFAVFYGLFHSLLHLPFPEGWAQEWLGLT